LNGFDTRPALLTAPIVRLPRAPAAQRHQRPSYTQQARGHLLLINHRATREVIQKDIPESVGIVFVMDLSTPAGDSEEGQHD
jgi:hypothetical protein